MDTLLRTDLNALLAPREGPCVSIYTPTMPGRAAENSTRFRDQLDEAARQLLELGAAPEPAETILASAGELRGNGAKNFWKETGDGLAAFLARDFARFYRLPIQLSAQVVVGPRFHVKALLPWFSDEGRFLILAISQRHVRLLEATPHSVRAVKAPGLPENLAEADRAHDRDEPLNLHTHPAGVGRAMEAVFHGQGVGIDDHKDELLRYCQKIDRAVRPFLNAGRPPLVLATVEYLAAIYRRASDYPRLVEPIIKGNPDRTSEAELHKQAWRLVQPIFREPAERAVARYRELVGTGRTAERLEDVLRAAHRGELETLLVAGTDDIWGHYDSAADRLVRFPEYRPGREDLANRAVADTLSHGRRVYAVDRRADLGGADLGGMFFTPMSKHGK